jgi:putative flippase GtrA
MLRLPLVDRVLSPTRGDRPVHKFIRYSLVSVVAIVISQATILICAWVFGLSGIVANTIGALAATPASYELNRKWAWGKSGKSHMWREVVPFWSLTLLGWLASTGTVEIADDMAKSHGVAGLGRALAIMGASLFAYGVVWIVKFVIFNRLVFVERGPVEPGRQTAPGTPAVAATAAGPTPTPTPLPSPASMAAPPVLPGPASAPVPPVAGTTGAGAPLAAVPVAAHSVEPAWEGPARAGR